MQISKDYDVFIIIDGKYRRFQQAQPPQESRLRSIDQNTITKKTIQNRYRSRHPLLQIELQGQLPQIHPQRTAPLGHLGGPPRGIMVPTQIRPQRRRTAGGSGGGVALPARKFTDRRGSAREDRGQLVLLRQDQETQIPRIVRLRQGTRQGRLRLSRKSENEIRQPIQSRQNNQRIRHAARGANSKKITRGDIDTDLIGPPQYRKTLLSILIQEHPRAHHGALRRRRPLRLHQGQPHLLRNLSRRTPQTNHVSRVLYAQKRNHAPRPQTRKHALR